MHVALLRPVVAGASECEDDWVGCRGLLDSLIPGWRPSDRAPPPRVPTPPTPQPTPVPRVRRGPTTLGRWVATQHTRRDLDSGVRHILDTIVPGWSCTDTKLRRRAALVADFLAAHGELPVRGGDRPDEADLAWFLRRCRRIDGGELDARWSPDRAGVSDQPGRSSAAPARRGELRLGPRWQDPP